MNKQGTKFLYSNENKDLYLESFTKRECVQSKNIYLLIDKDESERKLDNLMEHVAGCEHCLLKLKKIKKFTSKIDSLIPDPHIPRDLQSEFEGQLVQLLKEVDYKAVKYKPSLWESFKSLIIFKTNKI
jgi:hypothetical protein